MVGKSKLTADLALRVNRVKHKKRQLCQSGGKKKIALSRWIIFVLSGSYLFNLGNKNLSVAQRRGAVALVDIALIRSMT